MSEVVWKIAPPSSRKLFSACEFVRLPLWATASLWPRNVMSRGWMLAAELAARGAVASVADRHVPGQIGEHAGIGEHVADFAHPLAGEHVGAIRRDDAGRFLAPMLQCVQSEAGEFGCVGVTEHGKYAAGLAPQFNMTRIPPPKERVI